jgi:hypothetical protein
MTLAFQRALTMPILMPGVDSLRAVQVMVLKVVAAAIFVVVVKGIVVVMVVEVFVH